MYHGFKLLRRNHDIIQNISADAEGDYAFELYVDDMIVVSLDDKTNKTYRFLSVIDEWCPTIDKLVRAFSYYLVLSFVDSLSAVEQKIIGSMKPNNYEWLIGKIKQDLF